LGRVGIAAVVVDDGRRSVGGQCATCARVARVATDDTAQRAARRPAIEPTRFASRLDGPAIGCLIDGGIAA